MARDKGVGTRTNRKKDRRDSVKLQQSLAGGRIARRAQRRLLERQATFDAMKDTHGYHRPGSRKGHV